MPYSNLTGAVISGEPSAHELEMMQQPVDVRDGDDEIVTVDIDQGEGLQLEGSTDIVKIDTETGEAINEGGESEESEGAETDGEQQSTDGLETDGELVEEISPEEMAKRATSLEEAAQSVANAKVGQESIINKAIEAGLPSEAVEVITQEYNESGVISETSYKALAEAGYDKAFVDAYIAGQEAIAEGFVKNVLNYAGGEESFNRISQFMGSNQPAMADAFNSALERNDVSTIKALLDASKQMMGKTFGVKPQRNIVGAGVPAKATPKVEPQAQGFTSKDEMIKAMSDRRYERDAVYRREVERKVILSNF